MRHFIGQIILVGQNRVPDYLGKITRITKNEIHFRPYSLVDEYYHNDGYVMRWENKLQPHEFSTPRSLIHKDKIKTLEIPKDFTYFTEKI